MTTWKKYLFAVAGIFAVAILAAGMFRPSLKISWDYPADEIGTISEFRIYSSTNLTTWTPYATQRAMLTFTAEFPATNKQRFFRVKAVNKEGIESDWNTR